MGLIMLGPGGPLREQARAHMGYVLFTKPVGASLLAKAI
jgi:hypothetical protein